MSERARLNGPFQLFGAELSPYAVKVRAYLKFKGLEFSWVPRSQANQETFAKHAKLPLSPILVDADDNALQDSTPMIEALEAQFETPSIVPEDSGLQFLSALFEDYADEWLNKAMFHYRWAFEADNLSASKRTLEMLFEGQEAPDNLEAAIGARMAARLHYVGSSPETAPVIEASFARALDLLEAHFASGWAYLLGGRPCLGDFGLYGQLVQLASDPTPGEILRARAPSVAAWLTRMEDAKVEGEFASFEEVAGRLAGMLRGELAAAYLPWTAANAAAVHADAINVRIEIDGAPFVQKPQRYAAKCFAELKRKHDDFDDHEALSRLMEESGCAQFFVASEDDSADEEGGEEGVEVLNGAGSESADDSED